jgi:hypothetical protein
LCVHCVYVVPKRSKDHDCTKTVYIHVENTRLNQGKMGEYTDEHTMHENWTTYTEHESYAWCCV